MNPTGHPAAQFATTTPSAFSSELEIRWPTTGVKLAIIGLATLTTSLAFGAPPCPTGSSDQPWSTNGILSRCVYVNKDDNAQPGPERRLVYNIYCPNRIDASAPLTEATDIGRRIVNGAAILPRNPIVNDHPGPLRARLISVPHVYHYNCKRDDRMGVASHIKVVVEGYVSEEGCDTERIRDFVSGCEVQRDSGHKALYNRYSRAYKCTGKLFHSAEPRCVIENVAKNLLEKKTGPHHQHSNAYNAVARMNGKFCISPSTNIQCAPCIYTDKLVVRTYILPESERCPTGSIGELVPAIDDQDFSTNLSVPIFDVTSSSQVNTFLRSLDSSLLRNGGGLCLDVHAPDIARNGGKVQVWACNNEARQQQWTLSGGALVNAGGKCLDIHAPDIQRNGGKVQLWACNNTLQQQWRLDGGLLKNAGGLCLDVHAADMRNDGGKVQVWACNGELQQKWEF